MTPYATAGIAVALAATPVAAHLAVAGTRTLRTHRRPATPTHALLPLCAALEPDAWRSVVVTQQPGRIQVNGDGHDVVPLLAVALLAAIEQRTRMADVVRDRMAQAGQGEWVPGEEVVL